MTLAFDLDVPWQAVYRALQTVGCPKCKAHPGEECRSTGGGNYQTVATHKARRDRIAGWTVQQILDASALRQRQGNEWWARLPEGFYADTEAAATPIATAAKPVSPKSVRLSDRQAEWIESAAENRGICFVSTAHFHGDAARRQSVNALEEKGILRFVEYIDNDYARRMELTVFGWQVYRLNRAIIRRLDDTVAAEFEASARESERVAA